jgi:hypothetical protein
VTRRRHSAEHRRKAERLRTTVELLPRHTREAMLRGIDSNAIIVGGYTDGEGGVCPMLAAHRNGGRTSFASFADAWDAFTGAGRRPRRASRREVRALRTYLEMSLLEDDTRMGTDGSLAEIASQIRAERRELFAREAATTGGWSWLRRSDGCSVFEAAIAAASEQPDEKIDEREALTAHS